MLVLFESGPSRGIRCHWLMKEMGIPFESRPVDLKKGEHLRPEFLALNPFAKIPVLKDDDFVVCESVAICNYLADKFPEKGMIPKAGTQERARYDQWVLFCVTELEAPLWSMEKNEWLYPESKRSQTAIEAAAYDFKKAATVLNHYMKGREFILDSHFSAADVIVGHVMSWAVNRDLLSEFPTLANYRDRLKARPGFPKRGTD